MNIRSAAFGVIACAGVATGLTARASAQCSVQELLAADGQVFDQFGDSLALTPDFIAVAAPNHSVPPPPDDPDLQRRGQIYILARPTEPGVDEWIDEAVLFPASTAAVFFGSDVAADLTRVIAGVGTGSNAYIFRRDASPDGPVWVQETRLDDPSGGCCTSFGLAVAIDGVHAAVSDPTFDNGAGIVYVFHFTGDEWVLEDSLVPTSDGSPANFGRSLAMHGDRLIVGANLGDERAFVFRHDDAGMPDDHSDDTWNQEAELTAPDDPGSIQFGLSVDLQGNWAVVGAPLADNGGAAFVYEGSDPIAVLVTGTIWSPRLSLGDPLPSAAAAFGWSVSIDNDRIAVSANSDSSHCMNGSPQCAHGAVYHYQFDRDTPEILLAVREVPATTTFAGVGTSVGILSGANIPRVGDPAAWEWFAGASGRFDVRGSLFVGVCEMPTGCPGEGRCLVANGTPGCGDALCCTQVCEVRTDCCTADWDAACADLAIALCATACCDFHGRCTEQPLGDCVVAVPASRPADASDVLRCEGDVDGNGVDDACEGLRACCDPMGTNADSCANIATTLGETCPKGTEPQPVGTFCKGDDDEVDDVCTVGLDGDLNGDGVVGFADAGRFLDCLAGPGVPTGMSCVRSDADGDGDGDLLDAAHFQAAFFANCRTDAECDDGNQCTTTTCVDAGCVASPTLDAFLCGRDGGACEPATGACVMP